MGGWAGGTRAGRPAVVSHAPLCGARAALPSAAPMGCGGARRGTVGRGRGGKFTLKLLQPRTTDTMFLPMSCTSPFTVAMTKTPALLLSPLPPFLQAAGGGQAGARSAVTPARPGARSRWAKTPLTACRLQPHPGHACMCSCALCRPPALPVHAAGAQQLPGDTPGLLLLDEREQVADRLLHDAGRLDDLRRAGTERGGSSAETCRQAGTERGGSSAETRRQAGTEEAGTSAAMCQGQ